MKNNSDKNTNGDISRKRKLFFSFLLMIIVVVVTIAFGELLVRVAEPQEYMYPRFKFSPQYGFLVYENANMVHKLPGKWEFTYTINELQYRGKSVPISNSYEKDNIIILGDSYSFGIGVNDGEEYTAIMSNHLKEYFNVINLAIGAWGLTQQIRRFYEFGRLYSPKLVLLQFCSNDPTDNFNNQVTKIENGRFVFQDSNSTINWIKKYLSKSPIQKSQLYNFFRDTFYRYLKKGIVEKTKTSFQKEPQGKIPPEEKFYNELLELFAEDLNRRGIKLLMIAVNGQLEEFPHIKQRIFELDSKRLLDYYEVADWFENVTGYRSVEGHLWGKKAHTILGDKISEIIKSNYKNKH